MTWRLGARLAALRWPLLAVTLVLTLVLTRMACSGEKSVDEALAAADVALASNEPATALIEAKLALGQAPDSARARYTVGLALLRSGDAAGAEEALRRALALDHPPDQAVPALAQALLALRQLRPLLFEFANTSLASAAAQAQLKTTVASAYRAVGEPQLAEAALAAALAADPQFTPALLQRLRQQATHGELDAAMKAIEALLARLPAEADAWLLKGDLLRDVAAQPEAAVAAYRRAAELRPRLPGGHLELAETLLQLGRGNEATAPLDTAGRLAPTSARLIYLRALDALGKGDLDAAGKGAQVLLVTAADNPRYLQLAGDVALQSDALAQAEKQLSRVLQLAPQAVMARHLLARVRLRQQQPAQALETLKPLLDDSTTPDAVATTLAGDAWRASGNPQQAERLYARAAQMDPRNTRARTALALSHLAAGQGESGLAELRAAADAGPGVGPDLALITGLLAKPDLPQALAAIDALQRKLPGSPLPFNLRGRALLAANDRAGARGSFDQALALAPGYFPAIDGLAAVDLADKRPAAARQRFEALLEKEPRHAAALLALANLRAASGGSTDEVAELLGRAIAEQPSAIAPRLRLVDLRLRANDGAGAMAAAQDAVAALPESADALDSLGRVQLARGEPDAAAASFRKLVALQPRTTLPLLRLATAQQAGKDKAAAADSLRRALVLQPGLLEAQRGLVTLALESRDFAAALSLARAVQAQRPKEAAGYLFEGEVEAAQKHWGLAAAVYQRGLKQLPSSDLARRAHAALGAAGPAEARERFAASWLKAHPQDAVFRLYLGDVAAAQGDFVGAETMYTAVLALQPAQPEALNNLAWVSGRLGRPGALAYAEKAVALTPGNPTHLDTLAMLLAQKGDVSQALSWQRKALALQPANRLLQLNLARILVLAGQKDEARRVLQTLAELGSQFGGQAEVARLLQQL